RDWNWDVSRGLPNPQDIRALPATAGSVFAWNQALLHWGSRASRLGREPRVSVAFEFQRGDQPAIEQPLLDPLCAPTFEERIGLIAKLMLQYNHMHKLSPELTELARVLSARFPLGLAAAT